MNNSITFMGLEIGSWAEWFGGIITALGIYYAIRENKVKQKIEIEYDGLNLMVYLINNSKFDIKINVAYAFFYEKRFGGKLISQHNNPILPQGDVDMSELKPKNSYLTTFYPWDSNEQNNNKCIYVECGFLIFGNVKVRNRIRKKLKIKKN